MKTVTTILALAALTAAAPKGNQLKFRNLYKQPVREIKSAPNPRIIGGEEADPNSIPYQALLEVYSSDEGWYCGGSLISANYILTAGHCGEDAVEANVILGAHRALEGEYEATSTNIKVHEDYDGGEIINDVALIQLPEPVTFNDNIQPVALPSQADANNDFVGVTARASGWGLTDGFGSDLAEVLRYVDVEVISNQRCEEDFGTLLDSIVCTSGENLTGICNGDSGGPLIADGVQIGVSSFGIIFCLPGFASAFSRVTSFLDWISINSDVQIS